MIAALRLLLAKLGARRKAMALSVAIAYVTQAIGMIQGFVLIPLYIHYLGMEHYGYWLGLNGIVAVLSAADLGLLQALGQRVAAAAGQQRRDDISRYFWVGVAVYGITGAVISLASLALAWRVPPLLRAPASERAMLASVFAIGSCVIVVKLFNDFLRSMGAAILRPAVPLATLMAGQLLGLTTIILLLTRGFGLFSIVLGLAATEMFNIVVVGCFFIWIHLRNLMFTVAPNLACFREVLALVPYMLISQIGVRVTHQIDATIITILLGPQSTVIYTAHKKVADFLGRLVSILWGSAVMPLAHLAGEKSPKKTGPAAKVIFLGIVSLIALLASCYIATDALLVEWWIREPVVLPLSVIVLIAVARISDNFYNVASELHLAMGEIRFMATYSILTSISMVALYVALTRVAGLAGIPLALTTSSIGFGLFFLRAAQRRWGILMFSSAEIAKALGGAAIALSLAITVAWTTKDIATSTRWLWAIGTDLLLCLGWIGMMLRVMRDARQWKTFAA